MPCISLGRQSEEPRQRIRRSCEATAGVVPMFENEIVVGRFEHEHEHRCAEHEHEHEHEHD